MECVRRAVAVELEHPPPELSAVEEPYRKIVEEVATYVAERGRLEKFFIKAPTAYFGYVAAGSPCRLLRRGYVFRRM